MRDTVGWSAQSQAEPSFGSGAGDASIKSKLINLISAVRMLMRSKSSLGRALSGEMLRDKC